MEKLSLNNHYNSLGGQKLVPWWAKPELQVAQLKVLMGHLDLTPNSRVVDLGSGTCTFASLLQRTAGLQNPITCVDPSRAMLDSAVGLAGVETLCQAAEEWAAGGTEDCDRILIKAAIHHFDRERLGEILAGLKTRLTTSGRLVVQKSSADAWDHLPYPQAVANACREGDIPSERLKDLMVNAGFKEVKVHKQRFPIKISKVDMFEGFRQRDISGLAPLTDSQIEDGIREVDSRYPGDNLIFTCNRDVIVAVS